QFAEGLTDRQAAHAVRSRPDWKYALSPEPADMGFDFSVLSGFRARLAESDAGRAVFDAVLTAAGEAGLVKAGNRQRTDATHVLAVTRDLSRLEFVVETLRAALNQIAEAAGDWLVTVAAPEWSDRYSARPEDSRFPSRWAVRIEHGDQCGADGTVLLEAVRSASAPPGLRRLPAVEFLRQTWVQQFHRVDGAVRRREPKSTPPGLIRLRTPHEPGARTGAKRDPGWSGYKVHLSETCEPDAPHLITHIHTTPAPVNDNAVPEDIHTALAERQPVPDEHLVDAGYVDAEQIHHARRDHSITLVGPVGKNTVRRQATGAFFDSTRFTVDWDQRQAVCPGGHTGVQWRDARSHRGTPVTRVRFAERHCTPCELRTSCTTAETGRNLTLRPKA
ncbi:transposase, partial [Streptomyces antibioticus]|uniref:transposase n=1 Tax=Streptomyces antibioticus TaxID=1890 RepID=UPI0034081C8C